jgi:hypothetical protein
MFKNTPRHKTRSRKPFLFLSRRAGPEFRGARLLLLEDEFDPFSTCDKHDYYVFPTRTAITILPTSLWPLFLSRSLILLGVATLIPASEMRLLEDEFDTFPICNKRDCNVFQISGYHRHLLSILPTFLLPLFASNPFPRISLGVASHYVPRSPFPPRNGGS